MKEVNFVQCTVTKVPMLNRRDDFTYREPLRHVSVAMSDEVVPNQYVKQITTPIKRWRENCNGRETETLIAIDPQVHDAIMAMKVPELHQKVCENFQQEEDRLVHKHKANLEHHKLRYDTLQALADTLSNASIWTRIVWVFTGAPTIGVIL